jgi:transcriptional regulator with XRE-family HTH domain
MTIGERLRELREAKGLSQGDIGQRSGLFRNYISRVENGHTIPAVQTLERWAEALEVSLYELFFDNQGKPQLPPLKAAETKPTGPREEELFALIKRMSEADRELFLSLTLQLIEIRTKK